MIQGYRNQIVPKLSFWIMAMRMRSKERTLKHIMKQQADGAQTSDVNRGNNNGNNMEFLISQTFQFCQESMKDNAVYFNRCTRNQSIHH